MDAWTHACMHASCMHARMDRFMYGCFYAYVYIYNINTYTHIHMCIYIYIYICADVCK